MGSSIATGMHARGYVKGGVAAPPHTPLQPTLWTQSTMVALAGSSGWHPQREPRRFATISAGGCGGAPPRPPMK